MKPIISNDRIQTLGPHPEEAALFARPSRRMAARAISLVAVLRDARKSALLRTRLMDDIDMIRTMETLYYSGFRSYGSVVGWAKRSVPTTAEPRWARRAKSAPLPTLQVIPSTGIRSRSAIAGNVGIALTSCKARRHAMR